MGACNLKTIKIEKNIPPPPADTWISLVRHMEIGDSILVQTKKNQHGDCRLILESGKCIMVFGYGG